jgi:sugar phosphate isomerase/epimerase
MSKHYTDAWLFRCGDDRYGKNLELRKGLKAILKDAEVNVAFGPMTPFGNSLRFGNKDFLIYLLCEIETARHLGIKRIVFIDHLDCGAYTLEYGVMDPDEERERHLQNMAIAHKFFRENAPEIEFMAYLQNFDNFEKISF